MRCKRLESVKKKTYGYQERDHLKRQEFQERLKTKTAAQMVYVGICQIDCVKDKRSQWKAIVVGDCKPI